MNTIKKSLLLFLTFNVAIHAQAGSYDSLENNRKVIELIKGTAVDLCGKSVNSGGSTEYDISGNARATINGLMKKLTNIGVSVSGKLKENKYFGVLQKDVLENNKNISTCNVQVFNRLLFLLKGGGDPMPGERPLTKMTYKSDDCQNSFLYYEKLSAPGVYTPQSIWTCKLFKQRGGVMANLNISVKDRLAIDKNRGKITVTSADSIVRWGGVDKPIFTIGIKNTGLSTVQVQSIDVLPKPKSKVVGSQFFPKTFVLYPGDELLAPVGEFTSLAKLIDQKYDNINYTYTVSRNPNSTCHSTEDVVVDGAYSCEGSSLGFFVSIGFMDIFGDKYIFNTISFVQKQRWSNFSGAEGYKQEEKE